MKHAKRMREWAIKKLGGYTSPNPFDPPLYIQTTLHTKRIQGQEIILDRDLGEPYFSEDNVKRRLMRGIADRILENNLYTMEVFKPNSVRSPYYDENIYRMTVFVEVPEEVSYEG